MEKPNKENTSEVEPHFFSANIENRIAQLGKKINEYADDAIVRAKKFPKSGILEKIKGAQGRATTKLASLQNTTLFLLSLLAGTSTFAHEAIDTTPLEENTIRIASLDNIHEQVTGVLELGTVLLSEKVGAKQTKINESLSKIQNSEGVQATLNATSDLVDEVKGVPVVGKILDTHILNTAIGVNTLQETLRSDAKGEVKAKATFDALQKVPQVAKKLTPLISFVQNLQEISDEMKKPQVDIGKMLGKVAKVFLGAHTAGLANFVFDHIASLSAKEETKEMSKTVGNANQDSATLTVASAQPPNENQDPPIVAMN